MKTRERQHAMRTMVVLHSRAAAGPPEHIFAWLSPLAERGPVAVAVPAPGSAAELYATIAKTEVLDFVPMAYPGRPGALARHTARFAADVRMFHGFIRRHRPDLVVVVTSALPAALVASRLRRVSTVVFVGEILDKGLVASPGRRLAAAATARLTASLADALVCCSDAVAEQFVPLRTRLLKTIYPGVSGTHADGDGARFREMHGLTGADPCLAVIGNVTPARGQDVVIRALPALRAEFPAIRCVIAGVPHPRPGDLAYRQQLEALAHHHGVDDVVAFVGLVDPIADLYAASDIVVNPARFREPFGRVAIEALSGGCAVVAARVGAIPEVVRDGQEALLFDADDEAELRDAVVRLWRDPELREELVRNGRRRVATTFSEAAAVEAFAEVVDSVLGNGGRAHTRRPSAASR